MKLNKYIFGHKGKYSSPKLEWLYRRSWPIDECVPGNRIGIQLVAEDCIYVVSPENEKEEKIIKTCVFEEP